jgi:RNA polymerase sigma-70 factor (ECF subfamily)
MPGHETSLLGRAAAGDHSAVKACLARFGPIVWGLALRMSPSRADAEDAVQDIFLDLWTHGGRYDAARASEEAFVAVIARRRLIDKRRHAARRPALAPIEQAAEAVSLADSGETVAEAGLAARAMRSLPDEQREVLRLSVAQGLTHDEIAAQTGMPLGTVKSHARRGIIRIRSILFGEGTGEGTPEETT